MNPTWHVLIAALSIATLWTLNVARSNRRPELRYALAPVFAFLTAFALCNP